MNVVCVYWLHVLTISLLISCKVQRSSEGIHVTSDGAEALVNFDPFRIDIRVNGEIATILNQRGLLNIEHYREKKYITRCITIIKEW